MTWVSTSDNSLICIDQAHIFIIDEGHGSVLSTQLPGGREFYITPHYPSAEAVKIMAKLRDRIVAGQVIIHMSELTSVDPLPLYAARKRGVHDTTVDVIVEKVLEEGDA